VGQKIFNRSTPKYSPLERFLIRSPGSVTSPADRYRSRAR
jgi:hypothetical protein